MPGFVLLVRNRDDGDPSKRIGFTVSKKVGGAVIRNRMTGGSTSSVCGIFTLFVRDIGC